MQIEVYNKIKTYMIKDYIQCCDKVLCNSSNVRLRPISWLPIPDAAEVCEEARTHGWREKELNITELNKTITKNINNIFIMYYLQYK